MSFDRVQNLHNEIVSRLNQSGQQQQAAQHHPQAQPQQAQAQAQQRDPSNPHPDQYNTSNPTASNAYASTYAAYNNGNAHHNTQHAAPNQANTTANAPNMPADTNGAGTTGGPNANIMFDNENPIDIVLVLLHQYPQIETWLQSMEYHGTVTTSRTHAVQFLTSLMDSQPQFTQLIKLIQQQLKQRRAQGGDPTQAARNLISGGGSGINTGAPTQPNNVNIAQNNAIKAQQMTNNNMAMTEPDKLSKKERKSSRKSSKKSSKKKSKKSHKKSSKKSSKKSKKKKSKRKSSSKRGSNESDEDYGAAYPMNGGANESGSDFNPSSGRKSSPKKRRKKKRKKRHSSKRVVKEASEAEFTGGETEEEGEQIANMSGDESEDYNPGVAVGNVGSRRSDRKRRSKKRNIDQMSNGSHMTSRNKRQKTSHGPKNKNLMQYISPAPVHWKMMSCTDDGEEANSGRFRLKLKCIRHPIKEAVMRIGAHKFGLDDVLDTLCDVEQNGDEIRRSRSAKKRLKEELLQLRGCYNTKGGSAAIDSESDYNVENKFCDEFVANEFIKICQNNMDRDGAGDVSDDVCYQCGKCGELVCCDGCPHAFHLLCVGLSAVPDDKWFCGECLENKNKNSNTKMEATEDIVMDDTNHSQQEVKSKGSGIFSAIFMANKGDGRIGDLAEIDNALHREQQTEPEAQTADVAATGVFGDDEAFPEPDIDVVGAMDVDQSLPSPDAPDSGMDQQEEVPLPQTEEMEQPQPMEDAANEVLLLQMEQPQQEEEREHELMEQPQDEPQDDPQIETEEVVPQNVYEDAVECTQNVQQEQEIQQEEVPDVLQHEMIQMDSVQQQQPEEQIDLAPLQPPETNVEEVEELQEAAVVPSVNEAPTLPQDIHLMTEDNDSNDTNDTDNTENACASMEVAMAEEVNSNSKEEEEELCQQMKPNEADCEENIIENNAQMEATKVVDVVMEREEGQQQPQEEEVQEEEALQKAEEEEDENEDIDIAADGDNNGPMLTGSQEY
eukprot:643230_1